MPGILMLLLLVSTNAQNINAPLTDKYKCPEY